MSHIKCESVTVGEVNQHVDVILYAANTVENTVIAPYDACDKAVHILTMFRRDGHLPVFGVNDNVMK